MVKNKDGFGLPELITGILLFSMVSITVIGMAVMIMNLQTDSRYRKSATLAAQREIETLRNSNYASLAAGQTIDFTTDLPSDLPSGKSGTVVVSEPGTGLRKVDVTVSYPRGGNTKEVKLTSIIGQLGITQ